MIATKDPAVAGAENLWEALRSGFLGTEKTIVEIIKARAWEPLGYETFTDAWVKEVADTSIANELLPHVVYQMFAEGLTVDEVAETVKGIGADRAESLDRQRRHGIPAHAASMHEVRRHMRRRPVPPTPSTSSSARPCCRTATGSPPRWVAASRTSRRRRSWRGSRSSRRVTSVSQVTTAPPRAYQPDTTIVSNDRHRPHQASQKECRPALTGAALTYSGTVGGCRGPGSAPPPDAQHRNLFHG